MAYISNSLDDARLAHISTESNNIQFFWNCFTHQQSDHRQCENSINIGIIFGKIQNASFANASLEQQRIQKLGQSGVALSRISTRWRLPYIHYIFFMENPLRDKFNQYRFENRPVDLKIWTRQTSGWENPNLARRQPFFGMEQIQSNPRFLSLL